MKNLNMLLIYMVLCGNTPKNLSDKVNQALAEGWRPQGGISTLGLYEYCQALVKGE